MICGMPGVMIKSFKLTHVGISSPFPPEFMKAKRVLSLTIMSLLFSFLFFPPFFPSFSPPFFKTLSQF